MISYMNPWRQFATGVVLLLLLLGIGTLGYRLIEGWSFLDALYMTVTTVTTVGFREVQPMHTAGRVFTMLLILLGVGVALYILVGIVTLVVEGKLGLALGERRMRARIQALRNHYILCGFGRVGEEIGREFRDRGIPFVVVESNEESIRRTRQRGFLLVEGDAASDAVLIEAGIEHARCLLAASDSDAGNTYIILTAKAIRPDILVVARAGQPSNQQKMSRAGADRVISPYLIGGRRMALSALQPLVVDFVDTLVGGGGPGEHIIAEVMATQECGIAGCSLSDVLRGTTNANILAIHRATGEIVVGPRDSEVVDIGDRLIVMGLESDLAALAGARTERPSAS
jgi:voltage-gated potassium channel